MEPGEEEEESARLPKEAVKLIYSFGLEGSRRNNVVYVKEDMVMHSCGNAVHFIQLSSKKQTFLMSQAGRGIGAVALHPKRHCFAVCEKGKDPDIYVYAYPSLELMKVMKNGTERVFTAANFSNDGVKLATVGGHPDYWLTVWDWESESMILRSKAFSQEVFKVNFSTYFTGQLITSGVGHIRFWKMASTFTGLKLEGAIAKFGTVPISDVAGYVELRNSKVLSGTEVGTILVWDDGLIKAQLKRPGESMCHDGMIEYITLDEDAKQMTTAGADGFIRFWNLDWLDAANDGDDKLVCEITPVKEINVGDNVKIKGIIREADHWIIQDEGGALWKAKLPSFQMERVLDFHAGPINCVASSPLNYDLASGGSDGTVRLYNFKEHQQRYSRKFSGGVSSFLWLPLELDPTGNTVVAGFTDGVVRILEIGADHWMLSRAMKPHKLEVAALSFSEDGELLTSGSKDCTIFFFHCKNNYRALGFCKVPGPVTSMDWAPNGKHILVGCHNGAIVEVSRPGVDGDTSKSFELILPMKTYTFRRPKIVKPKPPPVVVPEVKTQEPKEGDPASAPVESVDGNSTDKKPEGGAIEDAPKDAMESAADPKAGTAEKAEGAAEVGPDGAVEGEAKPAEAPPPPPPVVEEEELDDPPGTMYPVRALMYTKGSLGTFYLALEGRASGYIYECHAESEEVVGYTPWLSCVKFLHFTHSCELLLSGSDDGVVRVQKVPPPSQLKLAKKCKHWEGGVHDGFNGVVGGAVLSFDDRFLASVSYDGSFFVQSINMEMVPEKPPTKVSAAAKEVKTAAVETEDVSAVALSIEEQRAKTEQDERLRLAMAKKNLVLERVNVLRSNLAALLKEMNERERNEKLPMEHFEIDPHVRVMLGEEMEREVDQAQKELQWDSEKRNVALRKLKAWYLDPLEVERIVLHAFMSGQSVSSFRTAALSPQLQAAIVEAKKQKGVRRWSKLQRGEPSFLKHQPEGAETPEENKAPENEEIDELDSERKKLEEVTKAEQRRLMLKIREKEMARYNLTKPDETWVSDEDAQAIEYAENNKGDFKLKSDPLYIVPEDLRVNARLKRNEMLLFSEDVYLQRMAYNKELLALRASKKLICEQIAKNNERVSQINNILKITNEVLFVPVIPKEENPEDRDVISLEEVKEFEEKKKAALEEALKANKSKDTLGMDQPTKKTEAAKGGPGASKERDVVKSRRGQQTKDFKGFPLSPLELAEQEAHQAKIKYEKTKLLEKNSILIKKFDNSLEELKATRFSLEINIKAAELKMLALYQELRYLQKIQPTEESLEVRINEKIRAVHDMRVKLEDQEKMMEAKKEEIALLNEKRLEIISEFDHIFPEADDPQKAILHKYFVKIIRRVKRNPDGTIADSDEDSDLEETAADEDEDNYEDDDVAEVVPPNVTQFFYDQMFKLRERRVEQDFLIKDATKALDALTRERDGIIKRKKLTDASLETVEKEIAVFQKEKQYSLNEIDIVLSLKMHQIEYLEDGVLPEDLSGALVFDNAVFQGLTDIITEHMKAKQALKELHKELRKEHQALNREKKSEDERTANIEARCVEVQMLKFGQCIDMEVLDVISKDMKKDTKDLKEQLRNQEANYGSELHDWNKRIEDATDELCSCTKDNAGVLNNIADLKTKQNFLTSSMKARTTAPLKDPLVEKKKHATEHVRLCEVIQTQDNLIRKMQQEMTLMQTELDSLYPAPIDESKVNRYSGLTG
ncbi:cilia- and flagella-associated protein 44 [Marchantia polymorpha subsp. ruderalis]|uniref:Cilia- and flagella-associated protein 44 n=2 Tax=Marchantia polymorpha TaxID=3197 RepID=A0AAF6BIJ7_MARPO|nr:hypothetical protein MARPO_0071s0099 [Marchantia polymorpha]BBN11831.1 hypothetical protein Mp_5g15100 [Marchantia polymorpha subsp. ruderalis]|eukprot:PTQ35490.1 hypothetical protein MARPO_0071s0099 [Marchantia polymorpha]